VWASATCITRNLISSILLLEALETWEQLKTTTAKGKEINKVCLNWFFDLCTMTKHQSEPGGATISEIWFSMNISLPEL
jgi:hypothetical protein